MCVYCDISSALEPLGATLAKLNGVFFSVYLELSLEDEEERECLRLRAGDLLLLLGGGDLRLGERLRPLPAGTHDKSLVIRFYLHPRQGLIALRASLRHK